MISAREPQYEAGVYRTDQSKTRRVCLKDRYCDCRKFQDLMIPCRHAQAACRAFGLDAIEYMSARYSLYCWKRTYQCSLQLEDGTDYPLRVSPISMDYLRDENHLAPPERRTPKAGRPQKKRRERQQRTGHQQKKRKVCCSKCGVAGHNKATCTATEAQSSQNSNRQRTQQQQQQQEGPSSSTQPTNMAIRSLSDSPVAVRNREVAQAHLDVARQQLLLRNSAIMALSESEGEAFNTDNDTDDEPELPSVEELLQRHSSVSKGKQRKQ